jgi:hypothetical protein
MTETGWLCILFAAVVTLLVLCWQKRARTARWVAAWLLGYADGLEARRLAVRWYRGRLLEPVIAREAARR